MKNLLKIVMLIAAAAVAAQSPAYVPMKGIKAVMDVYYFNRNTLDITAEANFGWKTKQECEDHMKAAMSVAAQTASPEDSFVIHCFSVEDKVKKNNNDDSI